MNLGQGKQKIWQWGGYFFVFLISFSFFLFLQTAAKTVLCPDSFYHAKIAVFLSQGQLIKNFNWLPYTILGDSYSNHHFLYHLILVPFVRFFDPLLGLKVATLIFATLSLVLFYWFLRKFKIKFAFLYTLLLLTAPTLLTRINLAKVPAAALIILFLGLFFLLKRKFWLLALISFLYVWFYNTWPIILVAAVIYCFSGAIKKIIDQWPERKSEYRILNLGFKIWNLFRIWCLGFGIFIKNFFTKDNLKLILFCSAGIIIGLVINPYFPQNLYFNWVHIVKIGLKNYQNILPVGAEWHPYDLFSLISQHLLIIILWFFAIAWFFVSFKKKEDNAYFGQEKRTLTFFILSALFFAYTIKSRRNIEYFIPLALIFTSFSFNKLFSSFAWSEHFNSFKNWLKFPSNIVGLILAGVILVMVTFAGAYFFEKVWLAKKNEFSGGASFDQYKGASQFLKEKTLPGEIIFHSSWDEFPALFYHNDKNYYINGLDPTFMYEKNKPLYWLWYNIVTGKQKKYLAETIENDFHARYIFIRAEKTELMSNFNLDNNFEKVYEDTEATIFEIKK